MAVSTDDASTVIRVDDWLNEQNISCIEYPLACCSKDLIRRRYLRKVLYKRLTIKELERRYHKVQYSLTLETQQAIQQGIDKFKSKWYVNAQQGIRVGTFYTPVSLLFTTLLLIIIFFPCCCLCSMSTLLPYSMLYLFCGKDNPYLCIFFFTALLFVILFPAILLFDIFLYFPTVILLIIFMFLGLILVELVILFFGLCYYGFRRLKEKGVFTLKWELVLISSVQRQLYGDSIITTTRFDRVVEVTLPRASLGQGYRIFQIFNGIDWDTYGYGDTDSVEHLTAEEVKMCELLKEANNNCV